MSLPENKTLAAIFDEVAREDTQGLIKKEQLLETDYPKEAKEEIPETCIVCNSKNVDTYQSSSDDSWPVIHTECQDCGAEGVSH